MNDLFQILGVLMLGAGLWLVHPAAALVTLGLLLFVCGGMATRRERKR
jgi:hypothetical protein